MQGKVLAQYFVEGPIKAKVTKTICKVVDNKTHQEQQEVDVDMFNVIFPKGHITRMDKAELTRLGFDKRPRLIDAETGDVVDRGGDPFDFVQEVKAAKPRTADAMTS